MKTLISLNRCLAFRKSLNLYLGKRYLLSPAYYCQDEWNGRLKQPLMQKIDANDFGIKVFQNFQNEKTLSAIDLDLLANMYGSLSEEMQEFILPLFKYFGKTQQALEMSPSYPYGLLRSLLEAKHEGHYMEMLTNKLQYRFFPDDFIAAISMDLFVKRGDLAKAATVAYDFMLQEDLSSHPISNALIWHVCYNHLKARSFKEPHIEEDNEETRYIKVDYVTIPYYDDHFDIPFETWKLGKTFEMLTEGKTDTMNLSFHLIGLALHEKFDQVFAMLESICDSPDQTIAKEAVEFIKERAAAIQPNEPTTEPKDVGLQTFMDFIPAVTTEQKEEITARLEALTEKLSGAGKAVDFSLEDAVNSHVSNILSTHEAKDTERHKQTLKEWDREREKRFDENVQLIKNQMRIKELGQRLREMQLKEENLRLFEDYDEISEAAKNLPALKKKKIEKAFTLKRGKFYIR